MGFRLASPPRDAPLPCSTCNRTDCHVPACKRGALPRPQTYTLFDDEHVVQPSYPKSWRAALPETFYCEDTSRFQYRSWQKSPSLKRRFRHLLADTCDGDDIPPKRPRERISTLRYADCTFSRNPQGITMLCKVMDEGHLDFSTCMDEGATFSDALARVRSFFDCDGIGIIYSGSLAGSASCTHMGDTRVIAPPSTLTGQCT